MTPQAPQASVADGRIRDTVRAFVGSAVALPRCDDDTNLFEAGYVNSLFAVQLVTYLERTFGITVESEDLDMANFASLNAMAAFVARKLGQG